MRVLFALLIILGRCFAQADQTELTVHSERAREAQQQGNFKTAAAEWEAITRIAPDIAEAYSNLGMMRHFDRQYPRAIDAFLQASRLNLNLVAPHLFLGIDYYLTARSAEAIPQFKTVLTLSPDDKAARKWLGMSLYESGDFKASVRELALASQIDPHDSDLLFYQSRTFSKLLFQSYDAIRQIDSGSPFLKALRDEHFPIPSEGNEGTAFEADLQSDRVSQAFERADNLIRKSPQNASYWFWFGKSSEMLGLKALDRFLAASPESYRVDQLRAEYSLAIGNDAEAIKHYRQALARKSNATQLHESLGDIFMAHHDYDQAIPEYDAEVKLNPYALVSLQRLGQAYAELHDPANASKYLNRALNINPRSYEALRALAKVCFERGDYSGSVKLYRAAIDTNHKAEPAMFFQLSQTYKRLGDQTESARWLAVFRQALAKQHASTAEAMNTNASHSAH